MAKSSQKNIEDIFSDMGVSLTTHEIKKRLGPPFEQKGFEEILSEMGSVKAAREIKIRLGPPIDEKSIEGILEAHFGPSIRHGGVGTGPPIDTHGIGGASKPLGPPIDD